jgi:hypothetical protein
MTFHDIYMNDIISGRIIEPKIDRKYYKEYFTKNLWGYGREFKIYPVLFIPYEYRIENYTFIRVSNIYF